jgi:hypothetical protein
LGEGAIIFMKSEFKDLVSSVLGDFLSKHAFRFAEYRSNTGGDFVNLVFESDQCKLRFYDSRRAGEVNCLVGRLDASNESDWTDKRSGWYYLRGLLEIGKGLSLEELQKLVGPPVTDRREQLVQLRALLDSGFENALLKLQEKAP